MEVHARLDRLQGGLDGSGFLCRAVHGENQRFRREVDIDVYALSGVCPEGREKALKGPVGRPFDTGGQDPGPTTDMQADVSRAGLLEQAV